MAHLVSTRASTYGAGLICGFRLGPVQVLDDAPVELAGDRPTWLHFNLSDKQAREWLVHRKELPEEARDLLFSSDPRIHLETGKEQISLVLGDIYHDFDEDPEGLGTLRIHLTARWLLSGRTHPLATVDVLRRELTRGADVSGTLDLLERLIEKLAQSFAEVVSRLADKVDDAEERILGGQYRQESTPLGNLRRLVARLRRVVGANRLALSALPRRLDGLYDEAGGEALRLATERLEAVGQDLDLVQERARLLQEEIASRLSEATSRHLFVISIATIALLPINLITGIFGMNVAGLPFAQSPSGFHWVMISMVGMVLLTVALLRRIGAL